VFFMASIKLRTYWLNLHTVLALSVGLLLVLQGITGSLNLFRDEIDQFLHPELIVQPEPHPPLSLDQILSIVHAAEPDRYGVWTLELPRHPQQALVAWFEKPRETVGAFYAPYMLYINPYNGELLAKRFWGQTETTWLYDLHSHWTLGKQGREYLAYVAFAMAGSALSGLVLWWPGWRGLLGAFRLRFCSSAFFVHDLHRLWGFFSATGLLLTALTGFYLVEPELIEKLTQTQGMGHGDEGPTVRSTGIPGNRPITLGEVVLIARGPFSQAQLRRISTPLGDTGTYKLNFRQSHEYNQRHPLTTVWIDRWSAQIRDVQNPQRFTPAQKFVSLLWPLHTSEVMGEWGRALWFWLGLSPLFLYISGIWIYIKRRRIKQ
jgi:uncharacterized iron-regulated membrane protein